MWLERKLSCLGERATDLYPEPEIYLTSILILLFSISLDISSALPRPSLLAKAV
jgi:hypothetical protein